MLIVIEFSLQYIACLASVRSPLTAIHCNQSTVIAGSYVAINQPSSLSNPFVVLPILPNRCICKCLVKTLNLAKSGLFQKRTTYYQSGATNVQLRGRQHLELPNMFATRTEFVCLSHEDLRIASRVWCKPNLRSVRGDIRWSSACLFLERGFYYYYFLIFF